MLLSRLILAAVASASALGAPVALADPDPQNNKNALVRTLQCDNGQTIVASFAGLEGSNFNVTTTSAYSYTSGFTSTARRSGSRDPTTTSTSVASKVSLQSGW